MGVEFAIWLAGWSATSRESNVYERPELTQNSACLSKEKTFKLWRCVWMTLSQTDQLNSPCPPCQVCLGHPWAFGCSKLFMQGVASQGCDCGTQVQATVARLFASARPVGLPLAPPTGDRDLQGTLLPSEFGAKQLD